LLFLRSNVEIMNIHAFRGSLIVRMIRVVAMTAAVTGWSAALLGTRSLPALFTITFVCAAMGNRQLLASERGEGMQRFRWSDDVVLTAFGGTIFWAVLPKMRHANPDAWFWVPVTIPVALIAVGTIAALYWPLHPFVTRLRRGETSAPSHSEFEVPLLCGSFFLVSGSLVFAASACVSLIICWQKRLHRVELQPMRAGCVLISPIES